MGQDVFISYARGASRDAAQRLRADLARAGLSVFLDERAIPFGAPFPAELANGLLDARAVVVFAEDTYFKRPWCVHELRLLTAAWRGGDAAGLLSTVVALPAGADPQGVVSQLPPPLAAASWPKADQANALVAAAVAAVQASTTTLRQRLAALNDDTTRAMLEGADQPLAWSAVADPPATTAPALWMTGDAPSPRGQGFIGRADALWQLVHECVTARAFTPARRVVVQGLGGSGKSLLAAEFIARHVRRFFPAGVVWIDAKAGPDEQVRLWSAVWRHFAAGAPPPDDAYADTPTRSRQLAQALGALLQDKVPAGALLWVIDGLPEPGAGTQGGIADWCPAPRHVSVLATTRRADTLRECDAVVRLGPLVAEAGLTLLTRPPADARWMADEDWRAVVRWVGGLPLVLAVLRESLLDGSLAVEDLRRAPAAEPAAESERLMEGLRGEVDDLSLRGAAEAFELSWRALAADPAAADAARRLALLAPVALSEPLLAAVAGTPQVGKLVRRGWLQLGGDAGARTFMLHRVPASVLRMKIDPPDAAFAGVFDGLARCAALPGEEWLRARIELHTYVVAGRYYGLAQAPSEDSRQAAVRLAVAAADQQPDERRGLRYLAGGLADAVGAGDAYVAALRSGLDAGDERAVAALPHVLQALPHSESAVQWMAELLADPRDLVRLQAVVHAPAVPALLEPVLRAVLAEPEGDDAARQSDPVGSVIHFDRFLEQPGMLPAALSHVLSARHGGPPIVRRRTATIMGRMLEINGRAFQAGGFQGKHVVLHLLHMALTDADAAVRDAAAVAAAAGRDAVDAVAWPALVQAVSGSSGADQVAALRVVGRYLVTARKPPAPRDVRIERDDEGGVRISGEFFPKGTNWPPHVVPQLIDWVLTLPADSSLQAARELMSDDQGLHDTALWVHPRLDQRDVEPVRRLADALCAVRPDFVNAPWWRGQARAALGDDAGACADLEAVMKLAPDFESARIELAEACVRLARAALGAREWDAAIARACRAAELQPDAPDPHHIIAASAFNAGRFAEAEAAASRVIELSPAFAESWWVRALARERLGRPAEARQDALQAVRLDPEDQRFADYLSRLEAS